MAYKTVGHGIRFAPLTQVYW